MLEDLSLVLNRKDKIAIIGEEGNGKSTLLKILINDPSLVDYISYSGKIDTFDHIIGYLPQSLDKAWLDQHVIEFLLKDSIDSEILLETYDNLAHLNQLASRLSLKLDILEEDRFLSTLSGGELIKLQLVKILAKDPDILLLDEPTNDLDLKTLKWLESFITDCELPILFVSHDETLLSNVANGILHIEQLMKKTRSQYTFERLNYQEYLLKRTDILKRDTMIARKEKQEYDIKYDKWRRLYQSVDHSINTVSRQDPHQAKMLKRKMNTVKAAKRRLDDIELKKVPDPEEAINLFFPPVSLAKNKVVLDLSLANLMINDKQLSSNIKLFIKGNKHIVIVGDNGVGKSTLLKIIYDKLQLRNINVAYMAQDYTEIMNEELTPLAYLDVIGNKEESEKLRSFLGNLKFTVNEMDQKIAGLSGGQKAKLALLKMVYLAPEVLLLDEPSRNLSPLSNPIIRQLLIGYQGCIIAVSHDRMFIKEVADEVYELSSEGLIRLYDLV